MRNLGPSRRAATRAYTHRRMPAGQQPPSWATSQTPSTSSLSSLSSPASLTASVTQSVTTDQTLRSAQKVEQQQHQTTRTHPTTRGSNLFSRARLAVSSAGTYIASGAGSIAASASRRSASDPKSPSSQEDDEDQPRKSTTQSWEDWARSWADGSGNGPIGRESINILPGWAVKVIKPNVTVRKEMGGASRGQEEYGELSLFRRACQIAI
jgi:hypothetical protein